MIHVVSLQTFCFPAHPPPNRAMARFSSLVAIAAVAVVTSDALVLNVDD